MGGAVPNNEEDDMHRCAVISSTEAPSSCRWVLICALLLLAKGHPTQAGINVWTSAGLQAESVTVLAIDPITPGTLYALGEGYPGGLGGVFKSTDGGGTWEAPTLTKAYVSALAMTNAYVSTLAIDPLTPSTLYAGTVAGAGLTPRTLIFKSTDAGATWNATGLADASNNVLALAIDPFAPSTLYAGTNGGGVYKSTDAGATWSAFNTGLSVMDTFPVPAVDALAIDPTAPETLYSGANACPEYRGCSGGVFKSTDAAATWHAAGNGLPPGTYVFVNALAIDPGNPRTVYAGTGFYGPELLADGGVFKSTDGGDSWHATTLINVYISAVALDPLTPSTLYAATHVNSSYPSPGVLKSTDAGVTWNPFNSGLTITDVRALAVDPTTPDTLYAGAWNGGVFSIQQVPVPCVGDCDGNGRGTVDELLRLVNIALGNPGSCPGGVPAGATVDIALILQAVNNALSGCPSSDLYVAASGALSGDGTISNPYRRITDAVSRARAERAAIPEGEIRIHVAPGTYVGSFDAAQLQQRPEYEVLPIILNVPDLAILGATTLVRDERGLPTAAAPDGATVLEPDRTLAPNQYLFLVTRTADGAAGNDVTIDGFVLDGHGGDFPGADVFVDRVSDFRISNNLVRQSAFGVMTRLASGTIEGNLLAENLEHASIVTGGSAVYPATVLIHANRATRNGAHGLGQVTAGWIKLRTDPGQNTLALLEPLPTVFDRNNPEDLQNIPDSLTVTLSDNDASNNGAHDPTAGIGIRFGGIWPDYDYLTANVTQPLTSHLTATVTGNTSNGNGSYGVDLEAGDPKRLQHRRFVQTMTVSFTGNSFTGNGRAPALFSFTYWRVSAGLTSPYADKFVEGSTRTITDADGELTGFDYDNPAADPINSTVLNNTLTVNEVEIPHGTSITPAH